MIQSYKIDSLKMDIKNLSKKTLDFTIKRIAEITGILLIVGSVLLFLALFSYSPEDPNFIFSDNTKIKNLLGFKGSYTSDLLFQSIGLISFFLTFTILFTGINLIKNKKFLIIIENIFFSVLYIILGSLFLTTFYPNSFSLLINGNGGFVGNFFLNTFFSNLINLNKGISYYVLAILIIILFLVSINFSISFLKNLFVNIKKLGKNKSKSFDYNQTETVPIAEEAEKLVQEDLPFNKKSSEKEITY